MKTVILKQYKVKNKREWWELVFTMKLEDGLAMITGAAQRRNKILWYTLREARNLERVSVATESAVV